MASIFDEIQTTKGLIQRKRDILYSLQDLRDPSHEYMIREKLIEIKALECYLANLEGVASAKSRDKIHSYNGDKANS